MSCLLRPILACALPALLLAMPVQAWAKSDTHYWASSSVSVKLNDKFVLTNDSSVRSSDAKGFYQAINHFMVGYKADKHITLTLGYMEQHGFVPAAEDTDDHVMTAKVIAAF